MTEDEVRAAMYTPGALVYDEDGHAGRPVAIVKPMHPLGDVSVLVDFVDGEAWHHAEKLRPTP